MRVDDTTEAMADPITGAARERTATTPRRAITVKTAEQVRTTPRADQGAKTSLRRAGCG